MISDYLIEVKCDERTREHLTERETCLYLEALVRSFFQVWTSGSIPQVKITPTAVLNDGRIIKGEVPKA